MMLVKSLPKRPSNGVAENQSKVQKPETQPATKARRRKDKARDVSEARGDEPKSEAEDVTEGRGDEIEEEGEARGDEMEEKAEVHSGDDCGVASDADCDGVGYEAGEDRNNEEVVEEDNRNHERFGVEEENCEDFVAEFGEAARDDADVTDAKSGDDIWDEEKIPDPLSESEDDDAPIKDDFGQVEPENSEELLKLGKTFSSPEDFKIAVLRYSLKTRYDIKFYKSQSLKIGVKCSDTDVNCHWRCYCSYDKKKHKMQIKVYESKHICVRSGYTKLLKPRTIAWLYSERLRKDPKLTKQEMVEEIKRDYNLTVSEEQCAKAKSKIVKERKATHEEHFARIWDYQAEIFRSNEGSTFEIETIPGPAIGSLQRFYRLFVCFKSQIDSWKETCRPIIGLDGAFLKWDIKGKLLAAVGRDGDNRIVPIAWGVVEIENDTNWDWFVRLLSAKLNLQEGINISIISDKQKGLVKAVHNVLPQAEHRQCARHVMDNWKRDSHDMELQKLFWKIARSYTTCEFASHMETLDKYNPGAFASLQSTNPQTWSRAFFRIGSGCNDNLNNLSESFNRTIRLARRKPLLDMLEDIRRQCMVRNKKRHIIAGRLHTRFTKRAHEEIENMIAKSQFCTRYMARNNKHEVELNGVGYCVDMNDNTCGCRKWQMTGIPCEHAASVIKGQKQKVEDYVNEWYTTKMWRLTYQDGIQPVQGKLLWPRVNRFGVLPPPSRRGNRGRPSNYARKKGKNESASSASNTRLSRKHRVMTCTNCKQEGHNKAGCNNPYVEPQPKRPRGRPRKIQEPRIVLFGQGQASQGESSQQQGSQGVSQGVTEGASQRQGSQRQGQGLEGWSSWFECSS